MVLFSDKICAQNDSNYNSLLETIGIFYYSP